MSFFSKLRERLTKSSSKIGQGLDDLVGEGSPEPAAASAPEAVAPQPAPQSEPQAAPQPQPALQPVPIPAPQPIPVRQPEARPAPAPEPAKKPGLMGRLFGTATDAEPRRELDDTMLEELEDTLVAADMGVETALRVTANIAEGRMGRRVSSTELKTLLADEIARIMTPVAPERGSPPPADQRPDHSRRRAATSLAAGVLLILAAGLLWWVSRPEPAGQTVSSVGASGALELTGPTSAGSASPVEPIAPITSPGETSCPTRERKADMWA